MQKFIAVAITTSAITIGSSLPSFSKSETDYEALITKTGSSEFLVDGAERIDHKRALELYQQGALFVDVRAAWRYNLSHVRGAVGLELKTQFTEESLSEHADKDQPVVFYCDHSACRPARFLRAYRRSTQPHARDRERHPRTFAR